MRLTASCLPVAILLCAPAMALSASETRSETRQVGDAVLLPAPDLAAITLEDSKRMGGAYRYGVGITAAGLYLGSPDFGRWEAQRGEATWRAELVSPGATSLDLHFSRLALPHGARLVLRGEGDGNLRVIGPNDLSGAAYASPYVLGERLQLELTVPAAYRHDVELAIGSVTHGYRGLGEMLTEGRKSGSCNVDTACPAGDAWRDQIDAVGHYTFSSGGSSYVCTGTLIGNTARSTTPYFLTANHCVSTVQSVASMVVYWNYQSATCRTPGSSQSGSPLSRSIASHSQSGATLRATHAASDVSLVELNTAVPVLANPYWSGWDRSGTVPTSAVGIHHPAGHEKRIAVENQALQVSGYGGGSGTTHWRVIDWDEGTTEGGSSGSGLWDQNKRLVGQLHGGSAACGNDLSDYYGRFSVSWTGGGSAASRLSDWLDAGALGVTTLDGYRAGGGDGSDTTPPTTPAALAATPAAGGAVALSWTASSDAGGSGLAGYRVERCSGAACSDFLQIGSAAATTYNDGSTTAGTTYRYRVRAVDGAGNVSAYSNIVSISAPVPVAQELGNGVPQSGLAGGAAGQLRFWISVPAGASNLRFQMTGGSGDADLYVRFGGEPSLSLYDCRPYQTGSTETCSFATPQAGIWHVLINGYEAFAGVSLTASYSGGVVDPGAADRLFRDGFEAPSP